MAASGVGQFSINVKSNLKDFYGELTKSKRTLKELTDKKHQLQIDSAQLDKLRDKSQRIAAEMRELRQQKTEIKLGMKNVENADKELKSIDQKIASLNRQKLEVDAEIQPIRTANVELHKVDQEIDRINGKKVEIDVGEISGKIGDGLDNLSSKVMNLVKMIGSISAAGLAGAVGVMKEAVNAASDLEQNLGGVEKLFGDSAKAVIKNSDAAYKNAGVSKNEYLEQATSFSASLISSLGGDQAKAAQYVDKALVDMSDNVNTFGTNAGLVQNAYEGFAKGNYTMLDNLKLGFGGTQEGAKQLINTYGGLDHEVTDMAEVTFPLLIESIHNAQKAMNISGTTAKEAATTYEGSSKMMKAAWNDFLATGDTKGLADSVPIYLENLDKKLKELTPKIIDGIKQMAKELPPKIKPVIEDIKKILTESLNSIFGEDFTKNFVDGMKPFTNIIKRIFDNLSKSTKGEKPDLSWVGSIVPNLLKLASGLKVASIAFKGISVADKVGLKIPSFGGLKKSAKEVQSVGVNDLKSLGLKMLTIAGISGNIWLAAKALQEVDKVKIGNNLPKKLLNLGAAVTAMGAFSAVVGGILKIPGVGLIIGSGAATIAGLSFTLKESAKAVQSLDGVNVNGDYIQKIEQIGKVLAALAKTSGGLLANNIFTVIGNAGALINDWLKEGQLKSFARMADTINQLAEMKEIKTEEIRAKLQSISSVTDVLNEDRTIFDYIPFVNNLKNLAEMGDYFRDKMQESRLKSFVGMMESLETLSGDKDFNVVKIKKNISSIKKVLDAFEGDEENGFGSIDIKAEVIKKFFKAIGAVLDALKEGANSSKLKSLVSTMKSFETLSDAKISTKKIENNLKNLKSSIEAINSAGIGQMKLVMNDKNITSASKAIESLKSIMENINSLAGNIQIENIKTNLPMIGEVVSLMNQHLTKDLNDEMMSPEGFKGLGSRVKSLKTVMENINSLSGNIAIDAIKINIGELKEIFDLLDHDSFRKNNENMMSTDGFKGLKSRVESLKSIMENINSLAAHIQNEDILANIEELRQIFVNLSDISGAFEKVSTLKEPLEKSATVVSKLAEIANTLSGVYVNANSEDILEAIEEIRQIFVNLSSISGAIENVSEMDEILSKASAGISKLTEITNSLSNLNLNNDPQVILELIENVRQVFVNLSEISGAVEKVASMKTQLTTAKSSIDSLGAIINSLISIQNTSLNYDEDENGVYHKIEKVRQTLVQLNDLPTPVGLEQIKALIQEFKNLVETLNGLAGLFKPVGEGYGKKVIEGFKSVDFESPASEKIRKLLSKLVSMKYQFREVGKQAGIAFSQGLSSKLTDIDLSGLSNKIRNAINSALQENYSTKIQVELETTETKKESSGSKKKKSSTTKASGGLISVPRGYKAEIQDSPEKPLLDNGEYVIPKKIVSALGVPFFEKLRSGQISRTFAGLAQSVSHTTSSVVNNNYHNDNRTQSYNVYRTGEQNLVMAANRRFRMA